MKQILYGGTVMTRDPACPMVADGAVVFDETAILAVGSADTLRAQHPDAAPIDARVTRGSSESTAGRITATFVMPKPSAVRRMVPMLPLSLG